MPLYQPGLLHTPVTPFTRERAIDFDRFAQVIEFHLANGADGLALPMHAGESVSLSDGERRALVEFAIKHVNGRKPIDCPCQRDRHRHSRRARPPRRGARRNRHRRHYAVLLDAASPRWCSSILFRSAWR